MPRAPRLEFPGAYYHIMNRGDHLEAVFTDDRDRAIFLTTLAETCGEGVSPLIITLPSLI